MICLSSFLGCSEKDVFPSGSKYYMRFKADGVQKEFIYTSAYFSGTANFTGKNAHVSLNAGTNDNTGNGFTININNVVDAPLKAGDQFSVAELIPFPKNGTPTCYLSYAINDPSAYNYESWVAEPNDRALYTSQVNITELDDSHVKGTFSGKLRERLGTKSIIITEGEFLVERK